MVALTIFRFIRLTLFIKFSFYQKEWKSKHAIYSVLSFDMEQTSGDACGKARQPRPRKTRSG
ncbi:hypothetical protein AC739_00980 [Planococcus glaciei]|nr:hypothetical protein AC739_00980 [Planococcus glaciei]